MSNNVGADTWNLISGAVGVLTVLPFIWAFVRYQHPETKMAELDSALKDTEALLRSVSEEGLLDPQHHVPHFTSYLTRYRTKAEAFREETFIVSVSWRKTFKAWSHGLSKRIATLCARVKEIRAEICETSAEKRMQLMKEDTDDVSPPCRTWRVKLLGVWGHIVSVVSSGSTIETTDLTSTSSTALVVSASVALAEDTRSASNGRAHATTTIARDPNASHLGPRAQSRKASAHRLQPARVPFRTSGTATRAHDVRMPGSTGAIRCVDRELATQRVGNVRLTRLAQRTRKQWSPASTKVHRPRCSRKQRGTISRPKNLVASRRTRQPSVDSDAYSSGEETACSV